VRPRPSGRDIVNVIEVAVNTTNAKKIVKEEIEKALREEGMKNIRVKAGKDKFILAGVVGSEAAAKRAGGYSKTLCKGSAY